jgi:hypothetical protein
MYFRTLPQFLKTQIKKEKKNQPHSSGLLYSSALTGDAVVAGRRQGVAGEHQWGPGVAPGKMVVGGLAVEAQRRWSGG